MLVSWERVRAQTSTLLRLLRLGLIGRRGSQMVAHGEIRREGEGASAKGFSRARLLQAQGPGCYESLLSFCLGLLLCEVILILWAALGCKCL